MRILVVNSFFPPHTTGSAHFTLDVAREYVRAGHEVLVLTTRVPGTADDGFVDGIRIVRVPARSLTPGTLAFNYALPFVCRPGAVRRVRRIVRGFRPDVVHQNGQFFDLTLLTTWVAWRMGVPRVLTIHTPLMHTNRWLRWFIATVDRTVLRALNAPGRPTIVGVDRYVCEMAQRRYRPRRGPVRFIPATLRIQDFVDGDGERVRRLHRLGNRPVILSIGHVIPIRSRVPLVRAMPHLVRELPSVIVLVVGEVYDDGFQRLAGELGVADHLVVVGCVPHREVADHLAAATVECHDLDGHSLGITTLEAMAAGVPTFARVRRDVFPGIDLDEWPVLRVVEQADPAAIASALLSLLRSAPERAAVATQQRAFVDRYFRSDVVAAAYLELFAELVCEPACESPREDDLPTG